ncbi:MAG: hypothetical protein Q8K63_09855, partial [Acidimicrobiales bacterium]|nr:hypothetical protein [Acidimicrobiales bacterium]
MVVLQEDAAAVDLVEARDAVHQRGLARAVVPDQAEDLAFAQLQVDVVDRGDAAEALHQRHRLEQVGGRAFEADLALLHEHGALGEVQRHVDGLFDQHDCGATRMDLAHDLEQLADDGRSQAGRQLVDHQQTRLGHERSAEGEHLLLAARQVARHLALASLEDREQRLHLGLGLFDAVLVVADEPAGEAQVLVDRQGREHSLAAGHERDAAMRGHIGRHRRDVLPGEVHRTRRGLDQAADALEQRRL